jgi:archaellum biogenesis ATPase FlaH
MSRIFEKDDFLESKNDPLRMEALRSESASSLSFTAEPVSPRIIEVKKSVIEADFVQNNTGIPVFQDQSDADNSGHKPFLKTIDDEGIITARKIIESEESDKMPLIEPIFPCVGVMAVVGTSDTGKSSFLRQLAFAIAYGESNFLGYKINAVHNRALYVTTEDDLGSIKRLLKIQFGIPEEIEKTERLKFIFDSDDILNRIGNEIAKVPVDLIIIDAFADIFTGQLNANNEVRVFLNAYRELAIKHNCLIIFLHHTGKWTENKEPNKNNSIGSQGFEAKLRLLVEIRKDPRDRGIRHLCIVKGNYLPDEFKRGSIATRFNERMLFENLGYGVPFDQLKIDPKSQFGTSVHPAKERALQMKASDPEISVRKITEKLAEEGFTVGKSAVFEWVKKAE